MDYEKLLFELVPQTREVMLAAKELNQGSLMRGRTGWIRRGIHEPESIYEHSCKVGLAAWYLFGSDEAVAQGVVHDFPEIYEPDHIPWEIDAAVKKSRETAAMKKLKGILPNGNYWYQAWMDYENKTNQVFELDKICPAIQAIDYLRTGYDLEEFYHYARTRIKTPQLKELLDNIHAADIPNGESAYQTYFDRLEEIQL